MSSNSRIEWTDRSWQVTSGCTMVSPGCAHCYAETMSNRLAGMARADIAKGKDPGRKNHYLQVINDKGKWNGKIILNRDALTDPLKWKKPARVFVNSMSDLFHKDVPFEFIDRVFAAMALCPQHTFQVLTKRPERMAEYVSRRPRTPYACDDAVYQAARHFGTIDQLVALSNRLYSHVPGWPLPNVWLGCSVENQAAADERIPHLLRCPAAVRFLSVEPLLGPVNLKIGLQWPECVCCGEYSPCETCDAQGPRTDIGWLIVGGESGHGARPCNVEWIRSIVGQCKAAGVPVFVKQLGADPIALCTRCDADKRSICHLLHANLKQDGFDGHSFDGLMPLPLNDPKGGDPSEWPADLRVREFPAEKRLT